MYQEKDELIISSGMDHRVSLLKLQEVKEGSWNQGFVDNDKGIKVSDI